MRISFLVLPLLALTLAACREEAAEGPAPDIPDECGASGWSELVGQHRDALAAITFPAPMRVIGPNDAVTMDFQAERLNVIYDDDGIITRVECG